MSSIINIVILGDKGVGKTTFLQQLEYGFYNKDHCPTKGAYEYEYDDCHFFDITVNSDITIDQYKNIKTIDDFTEKLCMYDIEDEVDGEKTIDLFIIMTNDEEKSHYFQTMWYEMIRYSSNIPIIKVHNIFTKNNAPPDTTCTISVKYNDNIRILLDMIYNIFP